MRRLICAAAIFFCGIFIISCGQLNIFGTWQGEAVLPGGETVIVTTIYRSNGTYEQTAVCDGELSEEAQIYLSHLNRKGNMGANHDKLFLSEDPQTAVSTDIFLTYQLKGDHLTILEYVREKDAALTETFRPLYPLEFTKISDDEE